MYTWYCEILRETVHEGQHAKQVQLDLRNGMLLLIFGVEAD